MDPCAQCHTTAHNGLYATREPRPRYVCFTCFDKLEPATVDRYDGWRDRETLRTKRAKIARANFREER
jgi:hypothetical protein